MNAKTKKPSKKTATASAPTAGDRLQNMEAQIQGLRNMIQVLAEEMDKLQNNQIAIAKRLEATLKVSEAGDGLSEKNVNSYVIQQQVAELKQKVDTLAAQGVLVKEETVGEKSFVVGREISKEGEVVSPRTQATVGTLTPEVQEALKGKKVGDLITFSDDKLSFQIDEIYAIVEQATQNNQAAQAGA